MSLRDELWSRFDFDWQFTVIGPFLAAELHSAVVEPCHAPFSVDCIMQCKRCWYDNDISMEKQALRSKERTNILTGKLVGSPGSTRLGRTLRFHLVGISHSATTPLDHKMTPGWLALIYSCSSWLTTPYLMASLLARPRPIDMTCSPPP